MKSQRYAFAFLSPMKLDEMIQVLTRMTPTWDWHERDNDSHFGGYLLASKTDRPKQRAFARIIEEDSWFAAELIFEPLDIADEEANKELDNFDAKFFDELVPALGATGLKPTDTYES